MGPLPLGGQRGLSLGFGGRFHNTHEIESALALWPCNFISLKTSTVVFYRLRGIHGGLLSDLRLLACSYSSAELGSSQASTVAELSLTAP